MSYEKIDQSVDVSDTQGLSGPARLQALRGAAQQLKDGPKPAAGAALPTADQTRNVWGASFAKVKLKESFSKRVDKGEAAIPRLPHCAGQASLWIHAACGILQREWQWCVCGLCGRAPFWRCTRGITLQPCSWPSPDSLRRDTQYVQLGILQGGGVSLCLETHAVTSCPRGVPQGRSPVGRDGRGRREPLSAFARCTPPCMPYIYRVCI
jgi:hypothetical protein